jgi:hypothetical protein
MAAKVRKTMTILSQQWARFAFNGDFRFQGFINRSLLKSGARDILHGDWPVF